MLRVTEVWITAAVVALLIWLMIFSGAGKKRT